MLIILKDIWKYYPMGQEQVTALAGVNLKVAENDFIAVMGASGSGKSTLMNVLGCLDVPSSGSYWLRDKEVSAFNDLELARVRNQYLGFVFQSFNLLPRLNALKNVMLPLLYSPKPVPEGAKIAEKLLEKVGLGKRIFHLPGELSGGERQRVAIARALINQPQLIFADEPTGNLDSRTATDIMDLFTQLHRQGQTIIMVTHEPDIAAYATRVITLRDGNIIHDQKQ